MTHSERPDASVLVWDLREPPASPRQGTVVLWRGYAKDPPGPTVSIVDEVEERSDAYRAAYLAWVRSVGRHRIGTATLIERLTNRDGFSYWWMSQLAQQFNVMAGSPVDDVIKAMAFETLLGRTKVGRVVLVSARRPLATVLADLCRELGIEFEWEVTPDQGGRGGGLREVLRRCPDWIQAVAYLGTYLLRTIPAVGRSRQGQSRARVTFFDVLAHFDSGAASAGRFASNYWTTLVDAVRGWGIECNWLHLFFRHRTSRTPRIASELVRGWNRTGGGSQDHALIDSALSAKVVAAAVRDFFGLRALHGETRTLAGVRPRDSLLKPWPLVEAEWRDSLCGRQAMLNCLTYRVMGAAVVRLPQQELGVFISENQPWEMALLHHWRLRPNGPLVGVPHTTVRYWDLRYFHDPTSYAGGPDSLPMPDRLAVNSPHARHALAAAGYPEDRMVDVEALRYLHLAARPSRPHASPGPAWGVATKLLVCGDFMRDTNRRLVALAEAAAGFRQRTLELIMKPHPAYPVDGGVLADGMWRIHEGSLSTILSACDVVLTSAITSAAVDAYCAGLPVVQLLDGETFNRSPLLGFPDVAFVRDVNELLAAIESAVAPVAEGRPYFWIDEGLPRWRSLIQGTRGVTP